jgi:hypothetical protein
MLGLRQYIVCVHHDFNVYTYNDVCMSFELHTCRRLYTTTVQCTGIPHWLIRLYILTTTAPTITTQWQFPFFAPALAWARLWWTSNLLSSKFHSSSFSTSGAFSRFYLCRAHSQLSKCSQLYKVYTLFFITPPLESALKNVDFQITLWVLTFMILLKVFLHPHTPFVLYTHENVDNCERSL